MNDQKQNNRSFLLVKLVYAHLNHLKLCCFSVVLLAFTITFIFTLAYYSHRFSLHNINIITIQTPQKLHALNTPLSPSASKNYSYEYNHAIESYPLHESSSDEELMRKASKVTRIENFGVPKIAFMFLIKGSLPLAPLWEKLFKGHEGFYTIYVHSDPSYKSSAELNSGVFRGRMIPSKKVEWGKFNMIEAELRLLANALQDVSNQRFLLLSETCIPLFNFSTIYSYLINSTQSYVQAYDKSGPAARGRYKHRLGPNITVQDWRKGSQWFEMDRELAIKVMSDQRYFLSFKGACLKSACYADEHYLPTWMNMNAGRRNSNRSITWVNWSKGGCHPAKYDRIHITGEFLKKLRNWKTCQYNGKKTNICILFARKFMPKTLNRLLKLAPLIMGF